MNMKTLLGTAAGLMVATGAYAADLPGEAAPAAVDYVKVCDAFGKGYFYIPGTETCLKIGGRLRAGLSYSFDSNDSASDKVNFAGSGRITVDTSSATDLGTLRTYIRFEGDDNDVVKVKQAFIQLGYVTVGRMDSIANSDVMFGDNGLRLSTDPNGDGFGDDTANGVTVMVDNLGGGFYAGAGVYAKPGSNSFWFDDNTNKDGYNGSFQAAIGLAKQSWGSADLSFVYDLYTDNTYASDYYGVKATGNFNIVDALVARATATYYHNIDDTDNTVLSLAAKYNFTDAFDVYAGGSYAIRDKAGIDNGYGLQLGFDYMIVPNLKLQTEVNYVVDEYTAGTGKDDGITSGLIRLERVF